MRNRPIRQLIKWFVNREKGKVVEARSEIRRRFPYIDWSDQKKFLLASLSSWIVPFFLAVVLRRNGLINQIFHQKSTE